MNQFKTFLSLLILLAFLPLEPLYADLNRTLTKEEVSGLKANIKKNPSNTKSRLFLAEHYYKAEKWQKVVNTLDPIVEKLPDHALFKLSQSYLKLSNTNQAEAIVNVILSKKDVKVSDYLLAVDIYSAMAENAADLEKNGRPRELLFATLKKAKNAEPKNLEIYEIWLKKLEMFVPHYAQEALRVLEDMEANKIPYKPRHYSLLCKYNHLAKFNKDAISTCQRAISQDPDNPQNYIYLGQTQKDAGNAEVGQRMLASVAEKFSQSAEAQYATAQSHFENKNMTAAYRYFRKAVQHPKAEPKAYLGLAKSAFELKKYGEALGAFVEHCRRSNLLDHEFRRASGLLISKPRWQERYRQMMVDCKPKQ